MSRADDARARIASNPFYVLEVAVDCSRSEMEREGAKLLAMLELKLASVAEYATPLGPRARTPELVRNAMAELRDPERRLRHELWARLGAGTVGARDGDETDDAQPAWADAMIAAGWTSR